jgi:hypothetical protein
MSTLAGSLAGVRVVLFIERYVEGSTGVLINAVRLT